MPQLADATAVIALVNTRLATHVNHKQSKIVKFFSILKYFD